MSSSVDLSADLMGREVKSPAPGKGFRVQPFTKALKTKLPSLLPLTCGAPAGAQCPQDSSRPGPLWVAGLTQKSGSFLLDLKTQPRVLVELPGAPAQPHRTVLFTAVP